MTGSESDRGRMGDQSLDNPLRLYLKQLECDLDLPYPERTELLAELANHLDELRDEMLEKGFEPDEAIRRAIATMSLDEEFIASIGEVHRPAVARALSRLPRRVALGVEFGFIGLLALIAISVIFIEEEKMLEFMLNGGVFMIPINLMGLTVVVLSIERLYSLFLKRDHSAANLPKRLLSLKFLGLACSLTGVIGTLVGLFHAFSSASSIAARFDGVFPIYEVVRTAVTTSIWGMTIGFVALCSYYLFKGKSSRIEAMRLG